MKFFLRGVIEVSSESAPTVRDILSPRNKRARSWSYGDHIGRLGTKLVVDLGVDPAGLAAWVG